MEAIPPQASFKLPVSIFFKSGVAGEWSVTTKSIKLFFSACHSCSLLARSRIGGAHLKRVLALGISSAAKYKYCGQVSTVRGKPFSLATFICAKELADDK